MSGSKWYKCDFHLHTSKSKCFIEDQSLSKWVEKVVAEKVDCVALTNHNSAGDIDELKTILQEHGVILFPGVEITCSDSKVHLLIIFDPKTNQSMVEEFLIKAGIARESFGEEDAFTDKSISAIADLAEEYNSAVIAAHIDEYSSLKNVISHQSIEDFLSHPSVLGIQVTKDLSELKAAGDKSINKILEITAKNKKSILTFSDNPSDQNNSKHGISGIGKKYSYVKMSELPTIASLKQALRMPDVRVINFFNEDSYPQSPAIVLEELKILDSNGISDSIFNFNSGFNAIIGGRGAGKSSILRILRLILSKEKEVLNFDDIKKDFEGFFDDKHSPVGEGAKISLTLRSGSIRYLVKYEKIKRYDKFEAKYFRINDSSEEEIEKNKFLDILSSLDIELFSQKQLYGLAENPGHILQYIDRKNLKIKSNDLQIEDKKVQLKESVRSFRKINDEKRIINISEEKLADVKLKLDEAKEKVGFDLDDFLRKREEAESFANELKQPVSEYLDIKRDAESLLKQIEKESILNLLKEDQGIQNYAKGKDDFLIGVKSLLLEFNKKSRSSFEKVVKNAHWQERKDLNIKFIAVNKVSSDLKQLLDQKNLLEVEVKKKDSLNERLTNAEEDIKTKFRELNDAYASLRELRRAVIQDYVSSDAMLEIGIEPHRDFVEFEKKIRDKIKAGADTFSQDISSLIDFLKKGKDVSENISNFVNGFKGGSVEGLQMSQNFKKKIQDSLESDLFELLLLLPQDLLKIKYKNRSSGELIDLSKGSHGQKTSAVLSILLHLNSSLVIIDQPEDDLDNKLIYGLIVNNILRNKNSKQMIMVTHNANIPVNGDADLIFCMDSSTKKLSLHSSGELDSDSVRDVVCDIMEGGTEAFNKRASKYGLA